MSVTSLARAPVTREEFLSWQEHPATRWVLKALEAQAQRQMQAWVQESWEQGATDANLLLELRTRADSYRAIGETSYEGFCQAQDQMPVDGE